MNAPIDVNSLIEDLNTKPIPKAKKTKATKPAEAAVVAKKPRFRINPQLVVALLDGAVSIVLITISLGHLARGFQIMTGIDEAEAWKLAIGIDVKFVVLELMLLGIASDRLRKEVAPLVHYTIVGLLAISAGLNALALGEHATGYLQYGAWGLGCVIPALIWVSTQALGKIMTAWYRNREA